MIPLTDKKFVWVTASEAIVDNAAFATATVDTLGFDYCTLVCRIGTTDIAMAALKVIESDASNMGSPADVAGTDFSSATNVDIEGGALALPAADSDGTLRVIGIDLRGRKRYLDLTATGGDGSAGGWFNCLAILERAEKATVTNVGVGGTGAVAVMV